MKTNHKKIRIISTNNLNQTVPEWVKEAWIGVILSYQSYMNKSELENQVVNIVFGNNSVAKEGGYLIHAEDAFEVLKQKNEAAFKWFQENSHIFKKGKLKPGWGVVFYESNCEEI